MVFRLEDGFFYRIYDVGIGDGSGGQGVLLLKWCDWTFPSLIDSEAGFLQMVMIWHVQVAYKKTLKIIKKWKRLSST